MPFNEVIEREVKAYRRFEVLQFLTEGQCQAGQSPHVKAGGCIQPLNVLVEIRSMSGRPAITFFSEETKSGWL